MSASAKPLPSNVPVTPTGLPELSKTVEGASDTNKSHNDEDRGNPGTMEELHKKCKGKRQTYSEKSDDKCHPTMKPHSIGT